MAPFGTLYLVYCVGSNKLSNYEVTVGSEVFEWCTRNMRKELNK